MSQIYCLRIDFASCLGFYTRTLLAKLCSVFKVLPLSCFFAKQTAFIFYQTIISLSRTFLICFFRLAQAFSAFTWRHLNILPAYLLLCKYFFSFYLFSFLTCLFLSSRRISRSDFINLPYFLRFGKSCSSFGFYVFLWNIYSDYSNYISRICFQL